MEKDFLASGNTFLSIFQTFLSVIYADTRHICQLFPLLVETQCRNESLVLANENKFSGQWKPFSTNISNMLKYPFHWKEFFHLLEICFRRILYYSQLQIICCLVETIFFHSDFFGNHYCNQREAKIFLQKILFLLEETVFFNFFQILTRMEASFWSSEIAFFKEYLILAS